MKRILQRMALVWISVLSVLGFSKVKQTRIEKMENRKPTIQHEVILDEFEISAFHSN